MEVQGYTYVEKKPLKLEGCDTIVLTLSHNNQYSTKLNQILIII